LRRLAALVLVRPGRAAALVHRLDARSHAGQRPVQLALALILGGAIGNVIDACCTARGRLHPGALRERVLPVVQPADSAITVGAALLTRQTARVRRAK